MKTEKRRRAATYIRMSSDQQAASPERQRGDLVQLAERENCDIVATYEDDGISGKESSKRKDFQRLMKDAAAGKFEVILLWETSRFSREDKWAVFRNWEALENAGVELIDRLKGRMNLDDVGGFITAYLDAHGAREEIIKMSARSVSGRLAKLRQGLRTAGCRVFGYDREFTDEAGKVSRVSFRQKFSKPKGWRFRIVPSDELEAIDAVRFIFSSYLAEMSQKTIAQELNAKGIKTLRGNPFTGNSVGEILQNPVYVGTLREGFYTTGEFNQVGAEGPIIIENAHEPLIDVRTYLNAQRRLQMNYCPHEKSDAFRFLLNVVCRCGECGGPMYAAKRKTGGDDAYVCRDAHLSIVRTPLEKLVLDKLREQIKSPNFIPKLRAAVAIYHSVSENDVAAEEKKLQDLALQISRGEDNLLLADTPEDFNALKKRLAQLREQRDTLAERIETRQATVKLTPAATTALAWLDEVVEAIDVADRGKLKSHLATVIRGVIIRRERFEGEGQRICPKRNLANNKKLRYDRFHVTIKFEPGVFDVDDISFSLDHFDLDPRFRPLIDFVRTSLVPIRTSEAATLFQVPLASALKMLKRGQLAGMVKWHGNARGGWVNAQIPDEQLPHSRVIGEVVEYVLKAGRIVKCRELADHFGLKMNSMLVRLWKASDAGLLQRILLNERDHGWQPTAGALRGSAAQVRTTAQLIKSMA